MSRSLRSKATQPLLHARRPLRNVTTHVAFFAPPTSKPTPRRIVSPPSTLTTTTAPGSMNVADAMSQAVLRLQLVSTQAEGDRTHNQLAYLDDNEATLQAKIRLLTVQQAAAKLLLKEIAELQREGEELGAAERRRIFADRVQLCGKTFADEASCAAFTARQEAGMERLRAHEARMGALMAALNETLSAGPAITAGAPLAKMVQLH